MTLKLKAHFSSGHDFPSCSQPGVALCTDDPRLVTCRFCRGILALRGNRFLRDCVQLRWLPYKLHGKDVLAQCDAQGRLCVEPDMPYRVAVVYSTLKCSKRYFADFNHLVPR